MTDKKEIEFTVWQQQKVSGDAAMVMVDKFSLPQPNFYDENESSFTMRWTYTKDNVKSLRAAPSKFDYRRQLPYQESDLLWRLPSIWRISLNKKSAVLTSITLDFDGIGVQWTILQDA